MVTPLFRSPESFQIEQTIGKGSFGFVYKATHKPTSRVYAIKVLNLDVNEQELVDVQQEIVLLGHLKQADAQNICRFYGCFPKDRHLWIVMDYCGGGSVRTLMKAGRIEEKYIVVILRETLIALHYIHKCGIIHRDIKAANILMTNEGRVQVCDFGVSAHLQGPQTKRTTFVGTPWWMAPEVIQEGQSYNYKADIWSLGITVLEMANGHPPFSEVEPMRALMLIPRQPPARLEGGNWTQPLRDFVACCLNELPEDRLSSEELLKTKLIKAYKNVPTTVLRDLVLRLEAWVRKGGIRQSLAGGPDRLGGAVEEKDAGDEQESFMWDFDTAASRSGYGSRPGTSGSSYSSADDRDMETVKPRHQQQQGLPSNPKAGISRGTDHPLLQLFANDKRSGSAQDPLASLQAPFQSPQTSFQSGGSSFHSSQGSFASSQTSYQSGPAASGLPPHVRGGPTPVPMQQEQMQISLDLPSFDDASGSIVIPDVDSPTGITQIEIPSDDTYRPAAHQPPSMPPPIQPQAVQMPAGIATGIPSPMPTPSAVVTPPTLNKGAMERPNMLERPGLERAAHSDRHVIERAALERPKERGHERIHSDRPMLERPETPKRAGHERGHSDRGMMERPERQDRHERPERQLKSSFSRAQRSGSAGTQALAHPPSPPRGRQQMMRENSPRRLGPSTTSAPSSPPRPSFTHAMPQGSISNTNAPGSHKAFHFPTKSAPNVSFSREKTKESIPPVPTLDREDKSAKLKQADSGVVPYPTKHRAQQLDKSNIPAVPPLPTQNLSMLSARDALQPGGSSGASSRTYGAKRSDLSLKLPPSPYDASHGAPIPSPGRSPVPAALAAAVAAAQQHALNMPPILNKRIEMPKFSMALNPRVFMPDATSEEIQAELSKVVGNLDTALAVLCEGMDQVVTDHKRQVKAQQRRNKAKARAEAERGIFNES